MLFSGKCCLCIKLTFPNIRKVWVTGFAYFFEATYISVCKEGNRVDFRQSFVSFEVVLIQNFQNITIFIMK